MPIETRMPKDTAVVTMAGELETASKLADGTSLSDLE